jgi:ferric-dicitrate binding protein FerR (iron transport regulator)
LESIQSTIRAKDRTTPVRRLTVWKWAGVAAAACLLLIAGYQMWQPPGNKKVTTVAQESKGPADLRPGKRNKAVLIMADNTQIELDSIRSGVLGVQGSSRIRKVEDGSILYENGNQENQTTELAYNILEIPVGSEFQLTLADGSKVWLNSASRLKFPVSFSGNTREVEVSGEAYFEVAPNKAKPFKVHFNGSAVEVLGTHFNVNAYENDHVQAVTLLEGSVKVMHQASAVKIRPGQQALLESAQPIQVKQIDTEEAVAWKNGYFMFVDENIRSIMKKMSRWYGFTVEYQGNVDDERFGGMVSKFKNVSEVLRMLESTGSLRFKIIQGDGNGKGNKILVIR